MLYNLSMSNFFQERDEKNTERIRELVSELPRFATEFFVGMQLKTSPLTRLNYAYDLRIFFDYLSRRVFKKPVLEITLKNIEGLEAYDIELFLEYITAYTFGGKKYRCGSAGKERKLSALRSFFKYYFKKDKIEKNVTTKVDMPKVHTKQIVRLEPNEIANLLDKIDSDEVAGLTARQNSYHSRLKIRDSAIVTLFLGTGIRISELVGLNMTDIHFESNSFSVTRKGGDQSQLYFSDEIAAALKNYITYIQSEVDNETDFGLKITKCMMGIPKSDGKKNKAGAQNRGGRLYGVSFKDIRLKSPLFLSMQGSRITVRAVENLVKKYSRLVTSKKITPHKLRSTFGTELYAATGDIYVVADVLGHKDVNTTKKHYAAISEEIRKNAAKSVKLRDK